MVRIVQNYRRDDDPSESARRCGALTETDDQALVRLVQPGSKEALDLLINRHQRWIYNIALRMVCLPQDAEDATQEILIKVLTKLSTFRGDRQFRTRLYRLAVNHLLNMKRARAETREMTFEDYGRELDSTPETDLPAPCRCAKKTQGFIQLGYLDPRNLLFARKHIVQVREVAEKRSEDIDALYAAYADIHRMHPFHEPPDFAASLRTLIERGDFQSAFDA